jgi:hypothetical protein
MKNVFRTLGNAIIVVLGFGIGKWLWDEILKEKFDHLKEKLSRKD